MSEMCRWLGAHGLGKHAGAFAENDVGLDVLADREEADLERLGVRPGDRKRILRAGAASARARPPAGSPAGGTGRVGDDQRWRALIAAAGGRERAARGFSGGRARLPRRGLTGFDRWLRLT